MIDEMFYLIFNLDLYSVILIIIALFALNILFFILVRISVTNKFRKTNSPEISLYFERNLIKYIGSILILLCSFFITLIIMPYIDYLGKLTLFAALLIIYTFMMLLLICQNLILFDINKEMRGTTITKKEQILNLVKVLMYSIIPITILLTLIDLKPYEIFVHGEMAEYVGIIFPVLIFILIGFLMIPLQKLILKGKVFDDEDTYNELCKFIESTGIENFKLYSWPTKNTKHANALVTGTKIKKIYISDYLLENFTLEETKSILAHEIGHIKKSHISKRSLYNIAIFIIVPLVYFCINKLIDYYYLPPLTDLIVVLSIIAFYLFFLRYYIYRKQEKEADLYVLKLGIEKDVYISALLKLSKLNHGLVKQNKIDENFQTHPSIARRIDAINKASSDYEQ